MDVKDEPLSYVICSGTPNLEIHDVTKAAAQASAVDDFMGIASGQRVERSTTVRRYLWSSEGGRGPTTSTWMCEKRRSGVLKVPTPDSVCLLTLAAWQARHERDQDLESLASPCHTNFWRRSFVVTRADGCEIPWMVSKTCRRRDGGTQGRGRLELISQRRWLPSSSRGMDVHSSADLGSCNSGSSRCCCCRAAR